MCSAIGFVLSGGILFAKGRPGSILDWRLLWAPATIASGLAAAASWRLIVGRSNPTRMRGGFAGALTGVLSMILMFWIVATGFWFAQMLDLVERVRDPINPLLAVPASAGLALWGLLIVGWLTVPIGAVAGVLFASWLARTASRDSGPASGD